MPDLSLLLPMIAALVVIGALAGVIGGLLGVGGGIVLVPAFFYAFGHLGYGGSQLMQVCVATSMATIVVTSSELEELRSVAHRIAVISEGRVAGILPADAPAEDFGLLMSGEGAPVAAAT